MCFKQNLREMKTSTRRCPGEERSQLRSSQCGVTKVVAQLCVEQLGGQCAWRRVDVVDSRDENRDMAGPEARWALKAIGSTLCEVLSRGLSGYDLLFKRIPPLLR